MSIENAPEKCENTYKYKGVDQQCHSLYNCCDCGGNDCGCSYCFSCKACDVCLNEE